MDFHLKPVSRQSQATGRLFEPGQRIVSYLCRDEEGELIRVDIFEEEKENYAPTGTVICRWDQTLKEKEDPAAEERQNVRSTEDMFLSLYDEEAETTEESDVLKYLLAIILELKRLLRPAGRPPSGEPQIYRHPQTGREYAVPQLDLTADSVRHVQAQLKKILL